MLKPTPRRSPDAQRVTHQAAKSAATRARIIEATIRCLVKYGYAQTTTLKVAAEADVSRGAMMHHFENAAALIYATAKELHQRRLQVFVERARDIDHQDVPSMARSGWEFMRSDEFTAFLELAVAARTDASLNAILHPLNLEYHERGYHEALEQFPEWESASPEFDLAYTLSQVIRHGLLLATTTDSIDCKMVEPVLDLFARQIMELRQLARSRSATEPQVEASSDEAPPSSKRRRPPRAKG